MSTVQERFESYFAISMITRGIEGIAVAMSYCGGVMERSAAAMKEWAIRWEIREWVAYDRAGAPYGYRQAGLRRWRQEQPGYWQ